MAQMTIAQKRARALNDFNDNYIHNIEAAKHIANILYRLSGLEERLLYLENDEKTCNRRYTREMRERADKQFKRLETLLQPYNLIVIYPGYLPTICREKHGREVLDTYYYE